MRRAIVASIFGVTLAAFLVGQSDGQLPRLSDSLERAFAPGGQIHMNLSAGEYRISGAKDHRIHVLWKVRNAADLPRVRVQADVKGSEATVATDGVRDGFEVEIQVPARSSLRVRLTAGDLTVEGIEGNKDIESHAGDLTIDVGRAEDYSRVDAALWPATSRRRRSTCRKVGCSDRSTGRATASTRSTPISRRAIFGSCRDTHPNVECHDRRSVRL